MADAAYIIFNKPKDSFTGNYIIDDTLLAMEKQILENMPIIHLMSNARLFVPLDSTQFQK